MSDSGSGHPTRRRARGRPHPRGPKGAASPSRRPVREVRRERAKSKGELPPIVDARERRDELEALTRDLTWKRSPEPRGEAAVPSAIERLHVVMVGWEWPPNHTGGLGVHCYELCRELTRMGHRVTFLTPFAGPYTPVDGVEFRHPGDPVEGTPDLPEAYWTGELSGSPFGESIEGYNAWVSGSAGIRDADVVHVHDWFGTVGGRELAQRIGVPMVMTVHSTEYDRSLGNPWEKILRREQFGVDHADLVIAVSQHLARQLEQRYHARRDRLRVIYNAVRPPPRVAPVASGRRTVLYLGRLAAMKGVETFLRAAARVEPAFSDVLFVVAGSGPEYPRLVDLAVHLGIGDSVLFLGHVTEEERVILLASASVFVFPSVIEPFGIAALEAMAAGVPVILSKTSGVAEIARNVFAVDFWDTEEFASRIAELLMYPVLHDAMGEAGRGDALREGWAVRAFQTVGVYAEVLRRAGKLS